MSRQLDALLEFLLCESPTGPLFYHASNSNLVVGKTYTARRGHGHFNRQIENLFEKHRPASSPSRKGSFFLVKQPHRLDLAVGEGQYIYTVTIPGNKVTRHHFGWFDRVLSLIKDFSGINKKHLKENQSKVLEYIQNYWDGKQLKHSPNMDYTLSTWEYMAPKITIVKKKDTWEYPE